MRAPANLSAVAEADKVTLRWDPVTDATQYNIYYLNASAVDKTSLKVANVASPHVVSGLENGEVYTFAVEAIKAGFAGPLSEAKSIVYIASTLKIGSGGASDSVASYLSLALDGNERPYLAFVDQGKALADRNLVRVVALENGTWVDKGKPSAQAPYTCCDLRMGGGDVPYLAFGDAELGNRITVKAFNGNAWAAVGSPAVTDSKAEFMAFALDAFGIPYVAYNDSSRAGRVSVRKLDGSRWSQVGLPGFSTNASGALSLAFMKSGLPCLSSGGSGAVAPAIMVFDGKNWNTTGDVTSALSKAAPGALPLSLSPGNLMYVGFPDKSASFRTTVLSSNGSTWSGVGAAGFSEGSTQAVSLAVAPSGIPYIAFADDSKAGRVSVMKFEGGSWKPACLQGFSKGRASYISLAIGKSGTVFVAYQDAGLGGRAQVVKLNMP
jgi:hypothetical protein